MPINVLAGIGTMSEFSMMTEASPWPISYGSFIIGAGLISCATFLVLRHLEARKVKQEKA